MDETLPELEATNLAMKLTDITVEEGRTILEIGVPNQYFHNLNPEIKIYCHEQWHPQENNIPMFYKADYLGVADNIIQRKENSTPKSNSKMSDTGELLLEGGYIWTL